MLIFFPLVNHVCFVLITEILCWDWFKGINNKTQNVKRKNTFSMNESWPLWTIDTFFYFVSLNCFGSNRFFQWFCFSINYKNRFAFYEKRFMNCDLSPAKNDVKKCNIINFRSYGPYDMDKANTYRKNTLIFWYSIKTYWIRKKPVSWNFFLFINLS